MSDERIPPSAAGYGQRVHGWILEALEEGNAFLKSQHGYDKGDETIQAVMGNQRQLFSSFLSSTTCNLIGKTHFDMAAGLTDTKPFWEYRTHNPKYEKNCQIYGKLAENVWTERGCDLSFMYGIQYAQTCGASYLEPYWDTEIGDFRAEAWDPRDIIPIRPTADPSIQHCYGVIARKARPVNHAKYIARHVFNRPDLAAKIQATKDSTNLSATMRNTRIGSMLGNMGLTPFQQRLQGDKATREIPRVPTVDILTVYIKDDAINETGMPIAMGAFDREGKPLNNWSHVVQPGDPLYPRKRMIVLCDSLDTPLYDGPSPWWHGQFPYPKLMMDPVPWSWFGKAPLWDLLKLNNALDKLLRVYDDWAERLASPDVYGNSLTVSKHALDQVDPRRSGKHIHYKASPDGKGVEIKGPDPLPQDFWRGIEYYETKIKELSGVSDISQMMSLKQMPSSDSVEKILTSMSLTWRLRSRVIEQTFVREFGQQMMFNFAQFYSLPKRLAILGAKGVTFEDFDRDPGSMVPDFVHESDFDQYGNPNQDALTRGPLPQYERTKEFMRQFSFHIAPSSLLASAQMEKKLMYLQLARGGMLDTETLLEELGIPNVKQVMERLEVQNAAGGGPQVNPAGRKASGQSAPRIVMKEST